MCQPNVAGIIPIVLLFAVSSFGTDCSISGRFQVGRQQSIRGELKDPMGSPIPGLRLKLVKGDAIEKEVATNNKGAFDFNGVAAGTYRIQVTSHPFCDPKVDCRKSECIVQGTLRVNPRKSPPIIVH